MISRRLTSCLLVVPAVGAAEEPLVLRVPALSTRHLHLVVASQPVRGCDVQSILFSKRRSAFSVHPSPATSIMESRLNSFLFYNNRQVALVLEYMLSPVLISTTGFFSTPQIFEEPSWRTPRLILRGISPFFKPVRIDGKW